MCDDMQACIPLIHQLVVRETWRSNQIVLGVFLYKMDVIFFNETQQLHKKNQALFNVHVSSNRINY